MSENSTFPHITHCDWSVQPKKRWRVDAAWHNGRYQLRAPRLIDNGLLNIKREPVFLGVDVPLGIPLAYAQQIRCDDFVDWLTDLGRGEWTHFYSPAETAGQISLTRPFYPQRPGKTKQQHLLDGLNVTEMDQLRRRCDLPTADRRAAASLFWTMGAQQVGKAAISFWRDWLQPARKQWGEQIALWPFEGELTHLLQTRPLVVAEAYPAEFYHHLGVQFPRAVGRASGKRVQADRQVNGAVLLDWAEQCDVELEPQMAQAIKDGFGDTAVGEDQFDATIGAMGMINIVLGRRAVGEPNDERVRKVEGHILGMAPHTP